MIEQAVRDIKVDFRQASENLRFAASVAEFGLLLRNSDFRGTASFGHVLTTAREAASVDTEGYRKEFISLVQKAGELKKNEKDITKN